MSPADVWVPDILLYNKYVNKFLTNNNESYPVKTMNTFLSYLSYFILEVFVCVHTTRSVNCSIGALTSIMKKCNKSLGFSSCLFREWRT